MNFFKSKSNSYFLILSVVTLIFITFIFYFLTNLNDDKKLISKLENSLTLTKDLLDEQKRYALSLSILLSEDSEIRFEIEGRSENFLATLDSRYETITSEHVITIKKADFRINLVDLNTITFNTTIHNKLMWGLDSRNQSI